MGPGGRHPDSWRAQCQLSRSPPLCMTARGPCPLPQSSWGPQLGAAGWGASRGRSSGAHGGRGSCGERGGIGRDLPSCRHQAQPARRERSTRLPVARDACPLPGSSTSSPCQPHIQPSHTPDPDPWEPRDSAPGPELVICRVTSWSSLGTSADSLLGKFGTVRHGQERLVEYSRGGGTGTARQGCVSPWVPTGVRGRVVGASV